MKKIILLNLLVLILFSTGCSKEDENTDNSPLTLTTEKELYAPFEVVTVVANEPLFEASSTPIAATIDGLAINIQPGDTTASFLLPSLENGNHEVELNIDGKSYKVSIVVQALTNVGSADSYFNDVTADIQENIQLLNMHLGQMISEGVSEDEYSAVENDIEMYTNILQEYKDKYEALNPTEKNDFANFMAANQTLIAEMQAANTSFSSALNNMRTMNTVQNYEAGVEISKAGFVASVILTVAHIPSILVLADIAINPNPWVVAAAVAGAGIILASFMVHVVEVKAMTGILLNRALKPYENLTVSQTVYQMGQEMEVDITGKYRSLIATDGSDGSVITEIVTTFNSFKNKFNNLRDKLPQKFRPGNAIQGIKTTFTSSVRSVYNQYINITNISNPNVTLQQINQEDGSIKLKASTLMGTDQQFTYDIEYTNSKFATGLKKTISAEVKAAVDSTEVYRNSAIGHYSVNGFQGNGPNSVLYCELLANNIAKYTIYSDPSWADGTVFTENWMVTKINGKYFITTSFTNPGHLMDEAQPLDYPVSSFIYRHTYVKQ